jgi:hypothetical protein
MFIGDRGTGVGSRIKGHLRYGGKWKEQLHSQYTNVCITNEHYTSQTCVFCYSKLAHPTIHKRIKGKSIKARNKGSFLCYNPKCPLVSTSRAVQSRDKMSAFAIGLSGLATVLFGQTFPAFTNISHSHTVFIQVTSTFLDGRDARAASMC